MFRRSISEVLLAHRDSHQAVEAFLTTGHDVCVDVRAVGDQWFSGEVSGADPCGVVIGFRAIAAIELNTATVDFEDTIQKQGFTIDNPNASGSCACGDSFS